MKNPGRNFELNEKNAYVIAVAIALILASTLLVAFYVVLRPPPDEYVTIYLLDSQKRGVDYPEFLIANVNSTFSIYVVAENHIGRTLNNAQILEKVVVDTNPTFPANVEPTQTFTKTLENGEAWENTATISLNEPGNYLILFELWVPNKETGVLQYSGILTSLNVEVVAETST